MVQPIQEKLVSDSKEKAQVFKGKELSRAQKIVRIEGVRDF